MIKVDLDKYKLIKTLKEAGLLDENNNLRPEAKEACDGIIKVILILFAIPTIAAALTVLALTLGASSGMLVWWFLFV